MRNNLLIIGATVLSMSNFGATAQNIPNPVIPGIADAGIMKYNGTYYLGGVATNGGFYISEDLVNWSKGPIHVFDMDNNWTKEESSKGNQIHADDINYINGTFHLNWSVNYWGKNQHVVHIGHATSQNPLGPYIEPKKDKWIDTRIDPKLFIDDNGKMYMYMVKFTDGNTIWGRPMKDPYTFSGEPIYHFAALPDTWETLDNKVAEGPWVMKYRDKYYMIYNANHTATEWGNYLFGVCEASDPLQFNHGGKYSSPILQSNQVDLEDRCVDLLRYDSNDFGRFTYLTSQPHNNWIKSDFDDSNWQKGRPGFGNEVIKGSTIRKVLTQWDGNKIYVRRKFNISKENVGNIGFRIYHDGETKVYLNGKSIYFGANANYQFIDIEDSCKLLKNGENIIAVESQSGKQNYLNFSLFDLKEEKAEDILITPGQPNVVKGPNGFEYWIVYMANKNREHRGQYINRIQFFGNKLTVDGISSNRSMGYHNIPTQPTFGDNFNDKSKLNSWKIASGTWDINNGELVQTSNDNAIAHLQSKIGENYLLDVNIKSNNIAGTYIYYKNNSNYIRIAIDSQKNIIIYTEVNNGIITNKEYTIYDGYKAGVYHNLAIYRNGNLIDLRIDNIIPQKFTPIFTQLCEPSQPALFSDGGKVAFDAIIYTRGWDEFNSNISGWKSLSSNVTTTSNNGLIITNETMVKGDLMDKYEFTTQLDNPSLKGEIGAYPIYLNDKNNIKVSIDYATRNVIVSNTVKGKVISENTYSISNEHTEYIDIKNSDFIEKQYSFKSPIVISEIALEKNYSLGENSYADFLSLKADDTNKFINNVHEKFNIEYLCNNKWQPLPEIINIKDTHPGYDKIKFNEVLVDAIRFTNKNATDLNRYINKIRITELLKQSYNLRVEKTSNKLLIYLDGRYLGEIAHKFAPSQVALFSNNKGIFNGITLIERP
ncbi:MAG: family 43 glycosylhydrolase [Muribaculaceae bacterium]